MISLEDQIGQQIFLDHPAQRIISLVPSQTELLYHFGLENETIGITKFCIHPESWFRNKTRVGGTKNVNIETVRSLSPDLIIANKEENTKEDIEALKQFCPVYVSDIITVDHALSMIKDIGLLAGKEQIAVDLIDDIQDEFGGLSKFGKTAVYLIWNDPYMAVGSENFINSIMDRVGLQNIVAEPRYVEISVDEINELDPELVLLSTEPFPFDKKHKEVLQSKIKANVQIVDGEMFSWYGSRMKMMPGYFRSLQF